MLCLPHSLHLAVLEFPVLLDPLPLARVVVHLEVRLDKHREVRVVRLSYVLLVLTQLDGHDVAEPRARILCTNNSKDQSTLHYVLTLFFLTSK